MNRSPKLRIVRLPVGLSLLVLLLVSFGGLGAGRAAAVTQTSGSVGIESVVGGPPPTSGATISFPRNGDSFTALPINVTGICPAGLLVELFKNNVFSGSQQCSNGNFSIKTDLFLKQNDLMVKVYDALDQAGPDSDVVTVFFTDTNPSVASRITLTSVYAKRGANPGDSLVWPVILSGGTGPYAFSVDWGDGKAPDLMVRPSPDTIQLTHVYDKAGVYNVIVKAADKNNNTAFLQLVAVANGLVTAAQTTPQTTGSPPTRILWWPSVAVLPLIVVSFWLGDRASIRRIRKSIELLHPE